MAPRAKTHQPKRARSAQQKQRPPQRKSSTPWPTIEAFIQDGYGSVSLGSIGHDFPLDCSAVATDEHNMLVALVRRRGETLHELLDRLERALSPAIDNQIFVDEINAPSPEPPKSRRR